MISHKHKFIYVQIPKTGGMSINGVLRPLGDFTPRTVYHQPIQDLLAEMKPGVEYYKFAFVRNPWDRLVSTFFFITQMKMDKSLGRQYQSAGFEAFIRNHNKEFNFPTRYGPRNRPFDCQLDWISVDGKIEVDFVGRFENLHADYTKACEEAGIRQVEQLPHANKARRTHYSDYYDKETRAIVAERCREDIEFFGYRFEREVKNEVEKRNIP